MKRTKLFVSYSREDREWLKRFSQHVAVLERRGLVELWSDARLEAGVKWENEIDEALAEARVAVLIVSPAFLASKWIWTREMPQIIAHAAAGMDLLPLIARPCAWRLENALAQLQSRPTDDRALSQGNESQIDSDLSTFAYELAARVGSAPIFLPPARSETLPLAHSLPTREIVNLIGEWHGNYDGARPIKLIIHERGDARFEGKMAYPEEGTITVIAGTIHEDWTPDDSIWSQIYDGSKSSNSIAIRFKENAYEHQGSSPINFKGEYRAIVTNGVMSGAWFSGSRSVGAFTLQQR
ncbi:toll/interleukin-1 receptor domain-containing protein [Labrys okinawensis]|uniref:toll/interleukin-1 receptor domain-containing protein n=1 Tax=Labrys okinawensis TaxID=346911 RepID=UPI0039BCD57D